MADPIKWRSKVILAKMETVYATDPVPTGGANAILMTDASIVPMEGEDVSRNLERPFLGNQGTIASGLRAVLTGSTELAGSGTAGTVPAWGVLARASGLAEVITPVTSVAYSPITNGHESVTIYFWIGNTRHVLSGARGTGVITVNAQGIPTIAWTLTGLWNEPGETAQATPDFTPWQAPLIASDANTPVFTVAAISLVMRNFSLNLGNQVEPRLLVGREEIRIVDRAEEISVQAEALPLSTLNPFTHGTVAGNTSAIAAPACEMQRPQPYNSEQGVAEWSLALMPLPVSGNDQFSITLT